jgi:tRNA threonylcarbamoyladenosine biosynthesis protein TsaE
VESLASLSFEHTALSDVPGVARWLLRFAEQQRIWLFEGQMGAGKTTLIQALCKQLGTRVPVQSPTFALVNAYALPWTEQGVYHFDFYRLKHESEALDIGFEEYLDSGHYCFIEWPSQVESLLPPHYLKIYINLDGQNRRNIIATHF